LNDPATYSVSRTKTAASATTAPVAITMARRPFRVIARSLSQNQVRSYASFHGDWNYSILPAGHRN